MLSETQDEGPSVKGSVQAYAVNESAGFNENNIR